MNYKKKALETGKRNKRIYWTMPFRVRKDSQLAELLRHHAQEGETSINFLITVALCNFWKCKLPHREYTRHKRVSLI